MNKHSMVEQRFDRGFTTLVSVLVLGTVGAAIATSLLLSGLNISQSTFALQESTEALDLSEACAEEALKVISENSSFAGGGSLVFSRGVCSYSVSNTGGDNRTINASSTVGSAVRKVVVTIDALNPQINISSWQGVADF